MLRQPALFISHGSPELALRETPAHHALRALGQRLARPDSIIVLSAHWETGRPTVAMTARPATIHDFGNFDARLREMHYAAPGAPELAERIATKLEAAGLDARRDDGRGFDHGVWVPLRLVFPAADIPVVPVSIQPRAGPRHHYELGRALRGFRDEGCLILTSGALTHNLRAFFGRPVDAEPAEWVRDFNEWFASKLAARDTEALLDYRGRAPHAARNHPTDEHLLPIFAALGATADGEPVIREHASYEHGVLAMDIYRFGA